MAIQQWSSLVSLIVVAVTAIVFCAKVSFRVDRLEKEQAELKADCTKHRDNNGLHRGADFELWLVQSFKAVNEKLDFIYDTVKHK